jgi:hypothetical protein
MKTKHDGYCEDENGPCETPRNNKCLSKSSQKVKTHMAMEVLNSTQELYELMQDSSMDINESDSNSVYTEQVGKHSHSTVKSKQDSYNTFKRFCKDADSDL